MASSHRDILIVDDDRDARELFSFVLEHAGATVTVAEDGESGLRAALEWSPDLVVTDIAMPRMDGINMVRQLRGLEPTKRIPIVAVTGHVVAGLPEIARRAGCSEVVPKPCSPDALIHLVNRHIGRRDGDRSPARLHPTPSPIVERRRH
jgi:two-component system, cell cycle response regulator DivK